MCINNNSTSMYQGSSFTRVYIVVEVEGHFLEEVVLLVKGITGRNPPSNVCVLLMFSSIIDV